MQHIGKVAEYMVLAELIQRDVEAYSAISFRQPSYDITVIRPSRTVVRVQVKATELQNKSTNNPIDNLEKDFDYLVIVVFDRGVPQYYVLTKGETKAEYGNVTGTIYTSRRVGDVYEVKKNIRRYQDKWKKIIGP